MSIVLSPKMYKTSKLKVKDKERVLMLVRSYANVEKINDEAKAATLLIYEGYRTWVMGRQSDDLADSLAKYFTLSNELLESLRIIVNGLKPLLDQITDDDSRELLKKFINYGEQIVNKAVVELSMENY